MSLYWVVPLAFLLLYGILEASRERRQRERAAIEEQANLPRLQAEEAAREKALEKYEIESGLARMRATELEDRKLQATVRAMISEELDRRQTINGDLL